MACLRGLKQFVKRLRERKSKILQFLFNTDTITTKKLNGMLNVLPLPQNCKNYVMDCRFVELRRSVPIFSCFYNLYHYKVRSICQRNTSQIISLCTVAPSQERACQICHTIATFARDVQDLFLVCEWRNTQLPLLSPRNPHPHPQNNPRRLLCNNPWKQQWTKEGWIQLHLKNNRTKHTKKRNHSISNQWSN